MRRHWKTDDILYAILEWEEKYGEPPKWREWQRATEDHPAAMTVRTRFGSWNNGIVAAGFTPRDQHSHASSKRVIKFTSLLQKEATHLRVAGVPDHEIAGRLGIARSTIRRHLGNRPKPKPVLKKRTREQRIADLHRALSQNE